MKRHFFAGYSYMGINFTYESPCWTVFMFDSKKERDTWVAKNEYVDRNIRAQAISQKIAYQIMGITHAKIDQGWYISDARSGRPHEVMFC
jgi:hypothetical protein